MITVVGIERRQAESVRETLYSECISHLTTAQTKAATFHGREAFLGEIKQRIIDGRRYDLILVMINPAILIESVRHQSIDAQLVAPPGVYLPLPTWLKSKNSASWGPSY